MRNLLFLSLFLLTSCSIFHPHAQKEKTVSDLSSLKGTSWELDSIINFKPEKLESPVIMTFGRDSSNSVYGYGGCNYFNGIFSQNGSRVAFSHLLSTKKYCFNGSKTETKFTVVLLTCNAAAKNEGGDKLFLKKDKTVLAILHEVKYVGDKD